MKKVLKVTVLSFCAVLTVVACGGGGGGGSDADTTAPSTPANVSASDVGASYMDLAWDASTDNVDVIGYNVYSSESATPIAVLGDVLTYKVQDLYSDTRYCYRVSAFDAASNESPLSSEFCTTTDEAFVVVANGGDNSVSIFSMSTKAKATSDISVSLGFPWEVTISPDGLKAYVSCRGNRSGANQGISVINLQSFGESSTISLTGIDPSQSAIAGSYLYVAYANMNSVMGTPVISVIDIYQDPLIETDVIELDSGYGDGFLSIEASADGDELFMGGWVNGFWGLDLASEPISAYWVTVESGYVYIHDMFFDNETEELYLASESGVINVWNASASVFGSPVPVLQDPSPYIHGITKVNGILYNTGPGGFLESWDGVDATALVAFADTGGSLYDPHGIAYADGYLLVPIVGTNWDNSTGGYLAFYEIGSGEITYVETGLGSRALAVTP